MKNNSIDKSLKEHIEKNVFPVYSKNDEGHNFEHIKYVINRSERLSKDMDIDRNILYTAVSYHDIGCHIDRETHEIISAQMMMKDEVLKQFFDKEELNTIKEAIEDHRASSESEPRTIYGKILSSADRPVNVEEIIKRAYLYGKRYFSEYSLDDHIDRVYNHFVKKYGIENGKEGYAKSWVEDPEFANFKKYSIELSQDKEKFVKIARKVIAEIEGEKK